METPREAEVAIESGSFGEACGPATIHFPPFRLDAGNERLWRGKQLIALRPKTFTVLCYLLERPGRLIRKEELLDQLWGDVSVGEAVLKTYLREIRQALGDSAKSPRFIETAHRRGYRFIGRVLREHEPPSEDAPASEQRPSTGGDAMKNLFRSAMSTSDAFVGRTAELERLGDAAREVLGGQRCVVFVSGQAGVGKTMLVRSFLGRLEAEQEFSLAWGQCVDQYGAGEAYLPVLEAIRRLARGPDRRALATILRREAPTWLSQVPGLVDHAGTSSPRVGFSTTPERLLCELAEALEAFTRDRPLILWFEDLHWADHSTLACISYLARRSDPARLLLVGSYRSLTEPGTHDVADLDAELARHGLCERLELGVLSPDDLQSYFERRFPGHRFPAGLVEAVHALTAGNPLFLDRVVDSWLKRDFVSRASGAWQLTVELERMVENAPASVVAMIEREMEAISTFDRGVLEAASVAGVEFSVASVAAALEEDLVRVEERCLGWARRGQFFRAQGNGVWPDGTSATRCEFVHALYRQVAYEAVGPARRARLHARIGAREQAAYGARAGEIAPGLALHFELGQEPSKAVTFLAAAGWQALRRGACREAIAHFQRGLGLLERLPDSPERRKLELDLLVALGAPLAMTLGHAATEVEQVYSRARGLCAAQAPSTHLFQALMGVGAFYLVRGEYETADALSRQFLALVQEQADPDAELPAFLLHGLARIFLGDLSGAERALARTVALYRPEQHRAQIFLFMQDPCVCALALSILPLFILGHPEQARERAEHALSLAQDLAHPAALVLAELSLAQLEHWSGKFEAAHAHAERGLALAIEHGFELYEHTLRMQLGATLMDQGERDSGLGAMLTGLAALKSTGSEFAGTLWRSLLAAGLTESGRAEEACAVLAEAFSRVERQHEIFWQPELYRALAGLLEKASLTSELRAVLAESGSESLDAEQCLLKALELARASGAKPFELRAAMSLARLWLTRGELARGRAELQAAYNRFGEGFGTADLVSARKLLAVLAD